MDAASRKRIRDRAGDRCEYPRQDTWEEHFTLVGAEIVGLTSTGRATTRLLQMNAKHRLELRNWLIEANLTPE